MAAGEAVKGRLVDVVLTQHARAPSPGLGQSPLCLGHVEVLKTAAVEAFADLLDRSDCWRDDFRPDAFRLGRGCRNTCGQLGDLALWARSIAARLVSWRRSGIVPPTTKATFEPSPK